MKKNRYIALLAGLSLALMSSPALAYPSADTLLVSGYDAETGYVLYGTSSIDQEGDDPTLDCSIDEEVEYGYEVDDSKDLDEEDEFTTHEVTDLYAEKDQSAEFFDEDDEDRVEGEGTNYPEAEDCTLTAVEIEPNEDGVINHGTIVSTFARLLEGGNGCLIRHFAQSDYGKGEYDAEAEADLTVMLENHETACKKGPGAALEAEGDDDESRGGPPPWAGKKGVEGDDDTSRGGPPPWAGKKDVEGDDDTSRSGPPPWAGKKGNG